MKKFGLILLIALFLSFSCIALAKESDSLVYANNTRT